MIALALKPQYYSTLATARKFCTSPQLKKECFIDYLESDNQGVAILTLNRPAARNALGRKFMDEFNQSIADLRFNKELRALIVKSTVDGVFCAGADLKERAKMNDREVEEFVFGLRTSFSSLENLPMPTIASIDGAALGGGLELALSCDIRVAGPKALLGLPETSLAIIPGAGGTQRLPRIIGPSKAKELIFTGRRLDYMAAKEFGLVNAISENTAHEKSMEIALEMLSKGPIALRMAKLAINRGVQVELDSGMAMEQAYYHHIINTQDRLEGLKAFREKRKPIYQGK